MNLMIASIEIADSSKAGDFARQLLAVAILLGRNEHDPVLAFPETLVRALAGHAPRHGHVAEEEAPWQ